MNIVFRFFGLGLIIGLVGCSEYGGGAGVVPTVTFIPADAEAAAGAGGDGAASPGEVAEPGLLTGKVVLVGSVTVPKLIHAKGASIKDAEVCAAVDMPDERMVLGDQNGVANVFIYLAKAPKNGKQLTVSDEPFLFDQKYCRFLPHCSVLPVGQTVKVLSDDTIAHNTHTNPNKNQGVSVGVAPGDREGKLSFVYKKAEAFPFRITCDYHSWMSAYHLPLDHPYAAVTDANGAFTIPDLPPGKHNFVVWHEAADGNYIERKLAVEIKPGATTEVQVEYPASKVKL